MQAEDAANLKLRTGGADGLTVSSSQQLKLPAYTGAGTHTGNAVKSLAVDNSGNVIEEDLPATTGKAIAMAIVFGG